MFPKIGWRPSPLETKKNENNGPILFAIRLEVFALAMDFENPHLFLRCLIAVLRGLQLLEVSKTWDQKRFMIYQHTFAIFVFGNCANLWYSETSPLKHTCNLVAFLHLLQKTLFIFKNSGKRPKPKIVSPAGKFSCKSETSSQHFTELH